MKSFFTRIKSKMHVDYGGRYLGEVLAEVIREVPSLASALWGKKFSKPFVVVTDYDYAGAGERLADLALIDLKSQKPLAIAEIKYKDEKTELSLAQLKDYLKAELPFVYRRVVHVEMRRNRRHRMVSRQIRKRNRFITSNRGQTTINSLTSH